MKSKLDRKRHILKAITWRIIGTFSNMLLAYLVTGSVKSGVTIGIVDFVVKFVLYYLHERAWYRVDFGKKKQKKS